MATQTENVRYLTAVMFIDIVGYTSLMQRDEAKAIRSRVRHREVIDKGLGEYGGKLVQYYGDGALLTFSSAVNAVRCSIRMQRELIKVPKVPVRIGIHLGDVLFDGQRIYGHAVNVAARIESFSFAGGILISEKIKDEITNHPIKTVPAGTFALRNVDVPIKLYAVTYGNHPLSAGATEKRGMRKLSGIACMQLTVPFISNLNEGILN